MEENKQDQTPEQQSSQQSPKDNKENQNIQKKSELIIIENEKKSLNKRFQHFDHILQEKTKKQDVDLEQEQIKLNMFFRYKISSVLNIVGWKNYYLSYMKDHKELSTKIKTFEKSKVKGNQAQFIQKLKNVAQQKSKYRFREKLNMSRALILKSLNYEPRNLIAMLTEKGKLEELYKDIENDDEDNDKENEKEEEKKKPEKLEESFIKESFRQYKQQHKLAPETKICCIHKEYQDLKNFLVNHGWFENPNQESFIFDCKFLVKKREFDFENLLDFQIVNHTRNKVALVTKHGIAKHLRDLIWADNIDIDTFYARCFDLRDINELEDFIEEFKFTKCVSILKNYQKNPILDDNQYEIFRIQLALICIQRKSKDLYSKIAKLISEEKLPVIKSNEWYYINSKNLQFYQQNQDQFEILKKQVAQELTTIKQQQLITAVQSCLEYQMKQDPQYMISGDKNIWIVKPAALSRGRGIRTFDDLEQLLFYVMGKDDTDWVAQKYIERPLIINKKKFDIRQWVLITDWNPITIWFYEFCYIRICGQDYNLEDLSNIFAHLTNNMIQQKSANYKDIQDETMMSMKDFQEFLFKKENYDVFGQKIKKNMQQIAINAIKSSRSSIFTSKNILDLLGFDFMIDEDYNVWLIEINSSPTMCKSTSVTAPIVQSVLEDTGKIIINYKCNQNQDNVHNVDVGSWKCIYREAKLSNFDIYENNIEKPSSI